jgi:hypothetical protein
MTQQEISRATGRSVGSVRQILGWLTEPTYKDANLKEPEALAPFIRIAPKGKTHIVTLLPPYNDSREIRFSFEDTDSRRIKVLEDEVRRLATKDVQSSKLSLYLKGDKQALVAEIEGDLGRALSKQECFLMGGMIEMVGPDRVKTAWRTKAAYLDKPVVALYAMFLNKALGQFVPKEEKVKEVHYPRITRDEEPV